MKKALLYKIYIFFPLRICFFNFPGYIDSMISHSCKNKVEYTASRLRRMIDSGELKPGMRLAASAEIAREFQVSLMTADRAIRLLAAEGKVKRINGSGTFIRSSSENIKIVIQDSFFRNFQFNRDRLYWENTYPLLEQEFLKYPTEIQHVETWEEIKNLHPDGILCSDEPPLDFECRVPIAFFRHYKLRDAPLIQCVPDLENVMRKICGILNRKKVKKIYIFTTSKYLDIKYFAELFLSWAEQFGLKNRIVYAESDKEKKLVHLPFQNGYQFGMSLPQVKHCAIFTTSDFLGSGILKALDDRGFKPREYDLVSCNNWEAYGYRPFPYPRLTSIEFRRAECMREVIRLLYDSIIHPGEGQVRIAKFPAVLKIRESGLR